MHLPPFPGADKPYKAACNMRFEGYAILKDSPIDATLLPDDVRERKLKLLYDNHRIVPMTEAEAAEAVIEPAITEEQKAKIDKLVADNTRDELLNLAPDKAAFSSSATKADIATVIVKAETAQA